MVDNIYYISWIKITLYMVCEDIDSTDKTGCNSVGLERRGWQKLEAFGHRFESCHPDIINIITKYVMEYNDNNDKNDLIKFMFKIVMLLTLTIILFYNSLIH